MFGLNGLMPDWPPSPKMVTKAFPLPLMAWVPLSCVPPKRSLSGFCTLTDRLWYCSVPRPLFIVEIIVGTFESQLVQSVRFAPARGSPVEGSIRLAHWLETSLKEPFRRQIPPSFAMKTMSGLNGVDAIEC